MRVEDVPLPLQQEIIRRHWQAMASRGGKAGSPLAKAIQSRKNAPGVWRLRRLRSGPTGRKPVDIRLRARLEGGESGAWRQTPPPEPPLHTEGAGLATNE